jgi:hypothetical protein
MLLQGSIQRFNVADVLQFLAQKVATGVLKVRGFEEHGFVYLVGGRVEGISLPTTDEKLGTRLIKAGYLSEEQLAEVLVEDSVLTREQRRLRPLGQRLVEMGLASEATVREVMRRQTFDHVFELAQWQTGVFLYDESERMPHFQVAIRGDVQELILEAQRRIDEGEHASRTGNGATSGVCLACRISKECTAAIKAKYRKTDTCLWRKMKAVTDDAYDGRCDALVPDRSKDENIKALLDASLDWH